jgi:hypothetical protein
MSKPHIGEPVIEHPNRDKAASKSSRLVVIVLLLISAALILIVLFGGWSSMQGMTLISLAWAIVYVGAAYFVSRWNRGVLPVLAALGIVMLIFAALATGSWFDRNTIGYTETSISASMLGTLTAVLIPVQALLILASLQAFGQQWNIEIEHWPDEGDEYESLPAGA